MSLLAVFRGAFELTKWFLLAALLLFLLHSFIGTIYIVSGESMVPNLNDGDFVVVNKVKYTLTDPQRGDIVVVRYPGDPLNEYYVKRVIGLPGDTVITRDGQVLVNEVELTERYLTVATQPDGYYIVPENSYFTLGDNRPASSDSRIWGSVEKRFMLGEVTATLWPVVQAHPEPRY